MAALAAWFAIAWRRKRDLPSTPWFLRFAALAGVAAVVALEAGWIVTEVGRQPWVVFQILRTADAVTHAPGVQTTFIAVIGLYTGLGVATLLALRGLRRRWAGQDAAAGGRDYGDGLDDAIPYGPHQPPGEPP
jgi:cytochrome d ubiquinol oxidase subunit I